MNNEINYVSPFKRFCISIGNLPTAYLESMSYYESLTYLVNYLSNNVIPALNNNGEVVEELQQKFTELKNYVDTYFDNLDVQEEINNKLDEMAESGQLTDIIAQYLGLAGMITFDTVADMKTAQNLVNGSKCITLGYNAVNDGGGALYKIRTITNDDIIDEGSIIEVYDNSLIAELIIENQVNILNFGYSLESVEHDETTSLIKNITTPLNNAISYLVRRETKKNTDNNNGGLIGIQIYFPDDYYYIDDTIDLNNNEISLKGNSPAIKRVDYRIGNFAQKILTNVDGAVFSNGKIHFEGLNFENIKSDNLNDCVFSSAVIQSMRYCHANNYDIVMLGLGGVATVDNNYFLNCRKYFCNGNLSDAILTNNYINGKPDTINTCINTSSIGMSLISGNFIDFFNYGIIITTQATGLRIVNNTFDYIYKCIDIGGASGVTISNNSFNHISHTYYDRIGYENTDSEASEDWKCIETRYTIIGLSIIGNTVEFFDKFINIPHINNDTVIYTYGNTMSDYTKFGSFVNGLNNKNIKFADLNEKTYSVEPTRFNTYNNQIVYYNGLKYKNKNTRLYIIGIENLENGVEKSYTTAGDGNFTIDFSTLPAGVINNSLILEIKTTQGYYTPSITRYNVYRIGGGLVLVNLIDTSQTSYKTNVTSSGLTLNVSFTGTVEETTSTSKQVFYRIYGNE